MPLVKSHYKVPKLLKNTHIHTIVGATLRKRPKMKVIGERLELSDGDFLDLDWLEVENSKSLIIITHGMEGSSNSRYVLHTMQYAASKKISTLAWNMRGCSGPSNRKINFYHSGKIQDLAEVVQQATQRGYKKIYLVGFSLGGNLQLLYLAKYGKKIPRQIQSAVSISAPVDLVGSQLQIERKENRIYLKRFLRDFKQKFEKKRRTRGIYIDLKNFNKEITTLAKLDRKFTAPWNGFPDEKIYYRECSSLPLLHKITIPFLLLNPKDDSFLCDSCYPVELARRSKLFYLEIPDSGGHCAMLENLELNQSYIERRILEFFQVTASLKFTN